MTAPGEMLPCPACKGTGTARLSKRSCLACDGTGKVTEKPSPTKHVERPPTSTDPWNEAIEAAVQWAENDRELNIDGLVEHVCAHLRALRRPAQPSGAEVMRLAEACADKIMCLDIRPSHEIREAAAKIIANALTAALARPAQGDEAMAIRVRTAIVTKAIELRKETVLELCEAAPAMELARAALATITGREG
jgi:hypothetical protein